MFQFTFDFTEEDALHFALFRILHTPPFKWTNRMAFALLLTVPLLPILLFLQDLCADAPWEIDAVLIQTILTTVLCVVLYRIYSHFSKRLAAQNVLRSMEEMHDARMFGIHTVIFEEMHIVRRSRHTEDIIAYPSITHICLSERGVYLFTAPTAAVILPLHIFASKEEKMRLLALVRAKMIQNHKGLT